MMQLDPKRLGEVPERYRKEAELHAMLVRTRRNVHPVRKGFASALRRLADAIEPAVPHRRYADV